MNNRKALNLKVGDTHACQRESIIYIPLKKHLTINSTWNYRLVLKALNCIILGDSLDPLRRKEQNCSLLLHHPKCSRLSRRETIKSARGELKHNLLLSSSFLLQLWLFRAKFIPMWIWNSIAWFKPKNSSDFTFVWDKEVLNFIFSQVLHTDLSKWAKSGRAVFEFWF